MAADSEQTSTNSTAMRAPQLTAAQLEVLKTVYKEQSAALRFETEQAHHIVAGFITIQLALAAWLAANPPSNWATGVGIFLINLLLGGFAVFFTRRNYDRRYEIIDTLKSVNEALGLTVSGAYLSERVIVAERGSGSWKKPVYTSYNSLITGAGAADFRRDSYRSAELTHAPEAVQLCFSVAFGPSSGPGDA